MEASFLKLLMDKNRFIIYKTLLTFEKLNREIKYILHDKFKNHILEKKDRRLITEIVYGSTRQRLNLDWKISKFYKGVFKNIDKELLVLLRMGVYQIFFCNNIPDYASVNSTVEISRKINVKYSSICNGLLRTIIRNKDIFKLENFSIDELSYYYSHPKWLIEKWLRVWNMNDVIKLMEWNNKRPDIWFRFNNNKKSFDELVKKFKIVKKNKYLDNYFTFDDTQSVLSSKAFKYGDLVVQNPTSGVIVDLLGIQPHDMILDACAAPGGKSTYIYKKMSENNILTCLEINKHRYEILKSNFMNASDNLIIKNIDFLKFNSNVMYDKILLDVPCIGTGVMSKRCDLRWLKEPKDIDVNRNLLLKMLEKAASLLSEKGDIVYSTCSIEEEDSSSIINEFLKTNNTFTIASPESSLNDNFMQSDGSLHILPHKHSIDGGYAAKLTRK